MIILALLSRRMKALRDFASVEHRLIGTSLLRIGLGILILDFYVRHLAQREFLWGVNGVVPFPTFLEILRRQESFSLYMLSPSQVYQTLVFVFGVLVAIAFTVGYRTRITGILFYVSTWSIYARNPYILSGGDNLLFLIAFYLVFANCGAYFSLDAVRKPANPPSRPIAAVIHNFAALAIITQICLLYFTSGFFKIQGHMWQDGTAIYYILRAAEFNLSPTAHIFYDSDAVVTLLTWSTMIFQIAWPFLIWHRRMRPVVAFGALTLHAMIGYFMGLVWFSAVMISAELIIFDDLDYARLGNLLGQSFASARNGLATRCARAPSPPVQ